MDNKALFEACASQCVWCAEQWPVITRGESVLHVAPFTQDPALFQWGCDSKTIRKAFKYPDYRGTKFKWTPPTAEVMRMAERLGGSRGLVKLVTSPKGRAFWRGTITASLSVASWPMWKRSIDQYGEKPKETTSEELKVMREELLRYDALDYWSRQPCTENLQYRPNFRTGHVIKPACNNGVGCTTCWERFEKFSDAQETLY